MIVSGEEAKLYDAVRLDSFVTVNQGVLVKADDQTGEVAWTDKAGETKVVMLGDHRIRLVRK